MTQLAGCGIRPITQADDAAMAAIIRTVMPEFGAVGCGFAISDPEVDWMSRAYAEPRHAYCVVERDGAVLGGGGIAPLAGGDGSTCELRKMYFLPEARGIGAGAAMMARCTKPERRAQFIEVLFKNQDSWAKAQDPKAALARIGKLGGMSQAEFDRCTNDQALFEGIKKLQLEAQQKYDVNATPTFIVVRGNSSEGEKISGAQPYEVFEKAFAKAMQ